MKIHETWRHKGIHLNLSSLLFLWPQDPFATVPHAPGKRVMGTDAVALTLSNPLKYFTVFTRSSRVASSSQTIIALTSGEREIERERERERVSE